MTVVAAFLRDQGLVQGVHEPCKPDSSRVSQISYHGASRCIFLRPPKWQTFGLESPVTGLTQHPRGWFQRPFSHASGVLLLIRSASSLSTEQVTLHPAPLAC